MTRISKRTFVAAIIAAYAATSGVAAIIVVAGASFFATMGASAAPVSGKAIAQTAGQSVHVIQVSGGCGRWHYRDRVTGQCRVYTYRR
jgi:hypothetical protein